MGSEFLEGQYRLASESRNFGYANPPQSQSKPRKTAAASLPAILEADEAKDMGLWPALFATWPEWRWGEQGTGDCVSWGTAHLGDVLLAVLFHAGKIRRPDALICQESIYGFGKQELAGEGYTGVGMSGVAAIQAWRRFGTLYRLRYEAGGRSIDLTRYDGRRAIQWGETPAGVPDALEVYAGAHKARDEVAVTDLRSAGALIQAGYPFQYCGYAYWGVQRTSEGIARRFSSGWHCMTATGVRYGGGREPIAFWIANTGHGDHVDGPAGPLAMPDVYAACGSWVPAKYIAPVLADGDCFATTFVEGWPVLDLKEFGFSSSRWRSQ